MRVISTIVGICLVIPIFIFSDTIVLNFAVAAISIFSVYEVIHITGYPEQKYMMIPGLLFAVMFPFFNVWGHTSVLIVLVFCYLLYLFCIKLFYTDAVELNHLIIMGFFTILLPGIFSTLIFTRNLVNGLFYMLSVFLGAWSTDVFAYLIGHVFGKRKLLPKISPNKTTAGAVGGVIATIVVFEGIGFWLYRYQGYQVNFLLLLMFAVLSSVFAQLGDLSASAIKRDFGAKDFGNLIPGHGGMLDRFDSFLFLAPFVYLVALFLPIIG